MKMLTRGSRTRLIMTAGAVVVALTSITTEAHATRYTVSNSAPDRSGNDGVCSLREAFRASNLRQPVDSCPAGEAQNEIVIVGTPQTAVTFALPDIIEVSSKVSLQAPDGPGFRQVIKGNGTRFVVSQGGQLFVSGLHFTAFKGTPLHVQTGGYLSLVNSEISSNTYPGGIYQTMGILNYGGMVYVEGSSIHHNESIKGGGILNQDGTLHVYRSAIYNNRVSQYGGAIHNVGNATAFVSATTLSGNIADEGGGVYNGKGAVTTLSWATVSGNRSPVGAGVAAKSGGTVKVRNSIVSGNTAQGGALRDCAGTLTSQGYNLLQSCPETASATGDIRNTSARLSALTFPTYPLSWKLPPWHAPLTGSPVINVIPNGNGGCSSSTTLTEQLNKPRLAGGACDMGAIERQ